ncbi:MAG TPA: hypothetical protein VLS25_05145 [Dehalococcoidia bacterium]|nr:hypothetical protein [Dehalococcoidia bacterium]
MIPHIPSTFVEAIRSLPRVLQPGSSRRLNARVHISTVGPEPGNWMITVRDGECFVEEGSFAQTNLRIHIPSDVALQIIRGEMEGGWAYTNGLVVTYGETSILRELDTWFGRARPER